jgi:O-antigen ligase
VNNAVALTVLCLVSLAFEAKLREPWIWPLARSGAFALLIIALVRSRDFRTQIYIWSAALFLIAGVAFGWRGLDFALAALAALHLRLGRDSLTKISWAVGLAGAGGMLLDRSLGILPIGNRNHFAVFTEIVLPFLAWRVRREGSREAIFAAGILLAVSFAGGSRMGAAVLSLELLWIAWNWHDSFRRRLRAFAAASVALVALGSLFLLTARSKRILDPWAGDHRREIWASSWEMILDRPWTGWGVDGFADAYPAYAKFDNGEFVNAAHSDWLEWGVEAGLAGMLAPLLLLLWYLRKYQQSPAVWGILFGAIHALVDFPWQKPGLLVVTALLAGSYTQYASQKTPKPAATAESANSP